MSPERRRVTDEPSPLVVVRQGGGPVVTPTFVLLVASVLFNALGLVGIFLVSRDTGDTADIIRRQTSDETAEERRAETERAIQIVVERIGARLDCAVAGYAQDIVDGFAIQGVVRPFSIMPPECTGPDGAGP